MSLGCFDVDLIYEGEREEMKIAVVSIGSFDTQYSDYHIMRDIIIGLLERGHKIDLIQKQYLEIPQYPQQFEKYFGKQLQVHNIRFEKKAKADNY